jgi:polysaccharide export outer membrane protein
MVQKLTKLFLFTFIVLSFSCSSYKNIPYFQDLDHAKITEENINNFSVIKVQKGDILGINVNSLNPEAASIFNTSLSRVNGNNMENTSSNPVFGFKVDADGVVKLPLIGEFKVLGKTTDEIEKQLTVELFPYLKKPIVNVRILNFKISVFGDVLKPDVYNVQNDHININEALSLAGDLTITAKRKNILLIRESNGKRQYFPVDMTKKEIFNSPYYYLQNNDILYIEPDKTKYAPVDRGYRTTSLLFSALSAVAVLVSAIIIQRR